MNEKAWVDHLRELYTMEEHKYKDELVEDVKRYIEGRCKYYLKKMDDLCVQHNCKDDWLDLPEIPLRQYKKFSDIVAELQLVYKEVNRIRISNIIDDEKRWNEYNDQTLIDMGR